MTRLADVADVIRSKNAGPYELTLDIIFTERFWFEEALRCEEGGAAWEVEGGGGRGRR